MKMTKEHFEFIEQKINELIDKNGKERLIEIYETGDFPRSERVKDLNKRFRWDLYWFSGANGNLEIVKSYNSDHINTALKRIAPEITRRY